MKFIYCTDLHYGATPICRKDDYNEAILNKLRYIIDYAHNNDINTIVIGGDLFDRPHQNYSDLIEIISKLDNGKNNTSSYIDWKYGYKC